MRHMDGMPIDVSAKIIFDNSMENLRLTTTALANTYDELVNLLLAAGYRRDQLSVWICDDTTATQAYWTMLSLSRVWPSGKLETTVQGLKMYHVFNQEFDITEYMQLGSIYSPIL